MVISAFPPLMRCNLDGTIIDGFSQGLALSSPRRLRWLKRFVLFCTGYWSW